MINSLPVRRYAQATAALIASSGLAGCNIDPKSHFLHMLMIAEVSLLAASAALMVTAAVCARVQINKDRVRADQQP